MTEQLEQQRVLLIGATGWFGTEVLNQIQDIDLELYCVASYDRFIETETQTIQIHGYDLNEIRNFEPTIVIDCAGLNRDRQTHIMFFDDCVDLTLAYVKVMSFPSVKAGMTFSSGAATFDPTSRDFDYYSASKVFHEHMASQTQAPSVIMRCYAVSGRHCQNIQDYAFSQFIDMAKSGTITVEAQTPVFRRYMAFDDYFNIGMAELGKNITIDSGGFWVEMEQLAQIIADKTNAQVERKLTNRRPTQYGAQSNLCHRIAEREHMHIKTITEQVDALL